MWKDIQGFNGKYKINEKGEVYSVARNIIMAQQLGGNGYYKVGLRKDGTKDRYIVHRLVAEHFIPNPHNKPQVNHVDGNPLNNNVDNLEWCTPSENSIHAFKTGLRKEHYKNVGKKFGSTSDFHYVERVNSSKDGDIFRTVVKATIDGKIFSRSRQFSVKKYGELEAELLAAQAANDIVATHSQFEGYALNVI